MEILLVILTTLLGFTNALTIGTSPKNYILDGNFSQINATKYSFTEDINQGNWSFHQAVVLTTSTADNQNLTSFYRGCKLCSDESTITQNVTGPFTNKPYTLSLTYQDADVPENTNYTLTATLDEEVIYKRTIYWQYPTNDTYQTVTTTFTPRKSSAVFAFKVKAPPASKYWELDLFNVALTGPN